MESAIIVSGWEFYFTIDTKGNVYKSCIFKPKLRFDLHSGV